GFITVAFREADNVEPVAAPAFAVVRRREETLDEGFVGIRPRVGDEGGDLLGSGRQPGEVEGNATDERGAVGLGCGGEVVFVELRKEESVNGRAQPGGAADGG